jgi:hypothetical protein
MCSKGNAVECQTATVRTSFPGCDCAVLALRRIGFSSLNTAVHVGGTQDRSRSELSVLPFEVLCCRQHKPTYVAQRFMWRSLQGMRKGGRFGVHKRHITFRSETAKELHDAWVLAPHLSLVPFPAGVTGRQRLRFHLKIDFGVDIGGVDGNVSQPRPDCVDVYAST